MPEMNISLLSSSKVLDDMGSYIEKWDRLVIVSYTPSLFLIDELNVEAKQKLKEGLKRRMREDKVTKMYFSQSGLRTIGKTPKDEIEDIIKIASTKRNVELYILEDKDLPSISIIVGTNYADNKGYDGKCDVFMEYRIGITREQLFRTGESLEGDDRVWIQYSIDDQNIPDPINKFLNLLRLKQNLKFEDWYKHGDHFEDPKMFIISAMPSEAQGYVNCLIEKGTSLSSGYHRGFIRKENNTQIPCLVAHSSYARLQTALEITKLLREFPSVKSIFFVGLAGGGPDLEVGDIVVTTVVTNAYYEGLIRKKDYESIKPPDSREEKNKVISLNEPEDLMLLLRASTFTLSSKFEEMLQGIDTALLNDKEVAIVRSYINKYSGRNGNMTSFAERFSKKNIHLLEPIWTSDHNINDDVVRVGLKAHFRTKVYDMESGGFVEAIKEYNKIAHKEVNAIIIRGISDVKVGDRLRDKDNQHIATISATAFLEYFLNKVSDEELGVG